ncbi:MAG: FHA domain-containing protein [Planctomycetia bacterium]|nr:FHA domain-containing protein [Planctomycetia bacterium]
MTSLVILRVLAGGLRGAKLTLTTPIRCILGRSRSCSIRLPYDMTVSRQHCILESDANGVWVRDLTSMNGTFVNGESIGSNLPSDEEATRLESGPHLLQDGDIIRVCSHVFHVELRTSPSSDSSESDSSSELPLTYA